MWIRRWSLQEPGRVLAPLPLGSLWILPALALAGLLRVLPLVLGDTPAGVDSGLYVLYAEHLAASGTLPEELPHYQLGLTRWQYLPGVPFLLALAGWLAGEPPVAALPVVAVLASIEVGGILLLAWRLFGRLDAALFSAAVAAVMPISVEMVGWGGYANLLGLALLPFAYVSWLDYWRQPGLRSGGAFVVTACAVAMTHHLSGLWMLASVGAACLLGLAIEPVSSLRKIAAIAPVGLIMGLPAVLFNWRAIASMGGATSLLTAPERFAPTQNFVAESVARAGAALTIAVLVPGLAALFFLRDTSWIGKCVVFSHASIAVILGFGWSIGVHFHHWRALLFLGLPTAIAAGALMPLLSGRLLRAVVPGALITSLAGITVEEGRRVSIEYRILSPALEDAARWLRANSGPDDLIVASNRIGFQLLRLLERPMMLAVPPRDFYSDRPAAQAVARDAFSILDGDREVIQRRGVTFVVVRAAGADVPDPKRSRDRLAPDPGLTLAFENPEVLVFRVATR